MPSGSSSACNVNDDAAGCRNLNERRLKEAPRVRIVICVPFPFCDRKAYNPYSALAEKLAGEFIHTRVSC